MSSLDIFHSCSFCGNDWTISQGYNPETKQCPSCDAWDRDEPAKKSEREREKVWWETEGRRIHAHVGANFFKPERKNDF